jgi:hypothetical protein
VKSLAGEETPKHKITGNDKNWKKRKGRRNRNEGVEETETRE